MSQSSAPVYVLSRFWKNEKQLQRALHLLCAITIGIAAALLCYRARTLPMYYPGPGDFNWALDTATALMQGRDPYFAECMIWWRSGLSRDHVIRHSCW